MTHHRLRFGFARHSGRLSARQARWLVTRYLSGVEPHQADAVRVYADETTRQVADVQHLAESAAAVFRHISKHLRDFAPTPSHIYLLPPDRKLTGKHFVQVFRWGAVVDGSACLYCDTPRQLNTLVCRELVRASLPASFGWHFFMDTGLAEYLTRIGDDTFYADVAMVLDNQPMYSLDDILAGYAPVASAGSFAHFLTERFGWEVWRHFAEDISRFAKKVPFLLACIPSRQWLLKRTTGLSETVLGVQWMDFAEPHCRLLAPELRRASAERHLIRLLYEEDDFKECVQACTRYLSAHDMAVSVVLYAVSSYMRLGDYRSALEVLSVYLNELPPWHRARAHLWLGALWELLGDRSSALRHFELARGLSDPWNIMGTQAEHCSADPSAAAKRLVTEQWLPFEQWRKRGHNDTAPVLYLPARHSRPIFTVHYALLETG